MEVIKLEIIKVGHRFSYAITTEEKDKRIYDDFQYDTQKEAEINGLVRLEIITNVMLNSKTDWNKYGKVFQKVLEG